MNRALAAAALAACLGASVSARAGDDDGRRARRTPVVEAVERVAPAVVSIGTTKIVKVRYWDWDFLAPRTGSQEQKGLGSGVIVSREGYIEVAGNVVVGESGRVMADISGRNITVAGLVKGNITGTGRLEILATGQVIGDITVASVMIDDGGIFQGVDAVTEMPAERIEEYADVSKPKPSLGISEEELSHLMGEGTADEIRAALPRMSPEMRRVAEAVLAGGLE